MVDLYFRKIIVLQCGLGVGNEEKEQEIILRCRVNNICFGYGFEKYWGELKVKLVF